MVFNLNGAHLHIIVNHLPVIGFLLLIAVIIVCMWMKSIEIQRLVLIGTMLIGLTALAPYLTGELAEEVVENIPGTKMTDIHEHEKAAQFATILSILTSLSAAVVFTLHARRISTIKKGMPVVLLMSVVTAASMAKTANEGGKIMHHEFRDDDDSASSSQSEAKSERETNDVEPIDRSSSE